VSEILRGSSCYYIEVFDAFMDSLSGELACRHRKPGRATAAQPRDVRQAHRHHQFRDGERRWMRLDNFAERTSSDGVSRSARRDRLYLAMHYAAGSQLPLTDDDFARTNPFQLLRSATDLRPDIDAARCTGPGGRRRAASTRRSRAASRTEAGERIYARLAVPVFDTPAIDRGACRALVR